MKYAVRFEPSGTEVEVDAGRTLLEAARDAGIPVGATCGGRGTCGKCQVRILDGPVPPPTPREEQLLPEAARARGVRLACTFAVTATLAVETLLVRAQAKAESTPLPPEFAPRPPLQRRDVEVPVPTIEEPLDDAGSLFRALEGAGAGTADRIDYEAARRLPRVLRDARWRVTATVRGGEVTSVRPRAAHAAAGGPLGLAVDLGTTTIAASLYRMDDGTLLSAFSATNPLSNYGADIVSRLAWAERSPGNGAKMQRVLVKTLNILAEQAAASQGAAAEDIEEVVVVGNTGMHHLFLDLPGSQLTRAPFVPALRTALSLKARELGIAVAPGGWVYVPPLVGGFVGSDLLSVALCTRLGREPGVRVALDIGTNTEVLLAVDGKLSCCSTASGPALEGSALKYGMAAAPGAIDRVWLDPAGGTALGWSTLGNRPVIGICGSGIIDAMDCLRLLRVVSATGRLQAGAPGVEEDPGGDHRYLLAPAASTALAEDLTVSQMEIRAVQLAKGAIRAGIDTLLSLHGLEARQVDEILVAGAFGTYLDIDSAVGIGLLPRIPPERIRQVGNAAATGAAMMLLSTEERSAAAELAWSIAHVELSLQEGFRRRFARAQWFPRQPA